MTITPENAARIAIHVRRGNCSRINSHPSAALNIGITASITRTFATVVNSSAAINEMLLAAINRVAITPALPKPRHGRRQSSLFNAHRIKASTMLMKIER